MTCRRELISSEEPLSLRRQCDLLEVCRGSYYYEPCPETEENLGLMRRLDELHLEHPVYGSRKLRVSWTPKFRPVVKMDFYWSAGHERKQMDESQTQTAQCGL